MSISESSTAPPVRYPRAADRTALERLDGTLRDAARRQDVALDPEALPEWIRNALCHSPHLAESAGRCPDLLADFASGLDPTELYRRILSEVEEPPEGTIGKPILAAALRRAKRRLSLLVGLSDIGGLWSLDQVTGALSDFAEISLEVALGHLSWRLRAMGEAASAGGLPGYVILAMGKLGARELNYSSDIDLIVLFDAETLPGDGRRQPQDVANRLTRDLINMLSEATPEGIVWRTDLRLRPDPAVTPIAVKVTAALAYYESMGRTWERAAMIKARPIAGDLALGRRFLHEIEPFVWRRSLDFAALESLREIQRQIHTKQFNDDLLGRNVKLAPGGIRDIEFFAQAQQMIFGGRQPELRLARTLEALEALETAGHVAAEPRRLLQDSYRELRRLEHRLQMVSDRQTHSLPATWPDFAAFARFWGNESAEATAREIDDLMKRVEARTQDLFRPIEPEPQARATAFSTEGEITTDVLAGYGFPEGDLEAASAVVGAWFSGHYRATRSENGRRRLSRLLPSLLEALGRTSEPLSALIRLDTFLKGLPAGIQLFALLNAHPALLALLSEIVGSSPALADQLARKPVLLDAVLDQDFFEPLQNLEKLRTKLEARLADKEDFEAQLDLIRQWTHDRQFRVGVQLLRGACDSEASGLMLTDLAEAAIAATLGAVRSAFEEQHGRVEGGSAAIVGLGKLGGHEMTSTSDLDLIFVYDAPSPTIASDGRKPLMAAEYFTRLAKRTISALSVPTGEGTLYSIDMRLRPSGSAGPVATTLRHLEQYHETEAWTWERMAMTKARPIAGDPALVNHLDNSIRDLLLRPIEPRQLLHDVVTMRGRLARDRPARGPLDIKNRDGALVDIEFLTQYLELLHAPETPEVLDVNTLRAIDRLTAAGHLEAEAGAALGAICRRVRHVQNLARLLGGPDAESIDLPLAVTRSLARHAGYDDFQHLLRTLEDDFASVRDMRAGILGLTSLEEAIDRLQARDEESAA